MGKHWAYYILLQKLYCRGSGWWARLRLKIVYFNANLMYDKEIVFTRGVSHKNIQNRHYEW